MIAPYADLEWFHSESLKKLIPDFAQTPFSLPALAVNAIVKERRLKQSDAAEILGIPQPKVSALANYRLDHFSVEKLISFLNALDQDVEIVSRPRHEAVGHTSVVTLS